MATQSVGPRRYLGAMLTLDSLKTEVDGLRETVRMADSDSVETRQLLKAQTSTMNALREDQHGLRGLVDQQAKVLVEQATAIGALVISVNQTQQDVHRVQSDVRGLQIDMLDLRTDVKMFKSDFRHMAQRQDRTEARQDRMDKNLEAIMRHLGVEPVES
jgi:chromosome segregation ATPase